MKVYCIDINNNNYEKIKKLNYIPVGLGDEKFKRRIRTRRLEAHHRQPLAARVATHPERATGRQTLASRCLACVHQIVHAI